MTSTERGVQRDRGVWLDDDAQREDLSVFTERARRLDEAAVVRLRERPGGMIAAWVATGFDVLASKVVRGRVRPTDLCAGADVLLSGLKDMASDGYVNPGFGMESAWRRALPPDDGFTHLDDVPARVLLDLAASGLSLAKDHSSAHGPPASLLDQEVVAVDVGEYSVGIPMRCVFALTAMGFLPQSQTAADFAAQSVSAEEVVRVRVTSAWLRIDARFGAVSQRRGDRAVVLR